MNMFCMKFADKMQSSNFMRIRFAEPVGYEKEIGVLIETFGGRQGFSAVGL